VVNAAIDSLCREVNMLGRQHAGSHWLIDTTAGTDTGIPVRPVDTCGIVSSESAPPQRGGPP
jgi:hypothetical protein